METDNLMIDFIINPILLSTSDKKMDLDTVFEEVVARALVNDEQPSLVGILDLWSLKKRQFPSLLGPDQCGLLEGQDGLSS